MPTFPRTTIRVSLGLLAFHACLLAFPGCAHYQVTVPDSDPIQLEGQDEEYVEKTMHAYFWGLVLNPQVFPADCKGQGINDVFVDRSWVQDLASVFTLGIWMPLNLRFRCKAPPTREGDIPLPATQCEHTPN